jgi:hypothetical protein
MQKGKISSFGATDENGLYKEAKVLPNTESGMPTRFLTIPWYLRGSMGNLEINTEVVFETFADLTGFIVGRFDGEWTGVIPYELLTEKGLTVTNNVTCADLTTSAVASQNSHVHGNGNNGADTTAPKG